MAANSRFVIAVHILCLLGLFRRSRLSSRQIAGSLRINPVQIRRVLPALASAGWIDKAHGADGGYRLCVEPAAIRLDAVRHAADDGAVFAAHTTPPDPRCPVGAHLMDGLSPVLAGVESAVDASLAGRSIADVLDTIRASGHPALAHIADKESPS